MKTLIIAALVVATCQARPAPGNNILVAPDYIAYFKDGALRLENKINYQIYELIPEWIIQGRTATKLWIKEDNMYYEGTTLGVAIRYRNSTVAFNLEMKGSKLLITTSINNWDFEETSLKLGFQVRDVWYNRTILSCDGIIHLDGFLKLHIDKNCYTESGIQKLSVEYTDGMYYITYPTFNQSLYHFSEVTFEHGLLDVIFIIYVFILMIMLFTIIKSDKPRKSNKLI